MSLVFTVAMPSYNRAGLLKTNLEIILNQINSLNISGELFLIDDGSTDGTRKVLQGYQADFPDIFRFQLQPKNQGIAKTRNLLVKGSKGKFIIFVDSDIVPSEQLLREHLKTLSSGKNIISQGSLILVSDIAEIAKKKFNPLNYY